MRSTEPIILAEILAVGGEEGVKSQSLQVETNTSSVEADYPHVTIRGHFSTLVARDCLNKMLLQSSTKQHDNGHTLATY